jgi:hypothetical protein
MRSEGAPIFISGVMPRSGTVWLRQLLLLHPRCAGTSPWEDWLVPMPTGWNIMLTLSTNTGSRVGK